MIDSHSPIVDDDMPEIVAKAAGTPGLPARQPEVPTWVFVVLAIVVSAFLLAGVLCDNHETAGVGVFAPQLGDVSGEQRLVKPMLSYTVPAPASQLAPAGAVENNNLHKEIDTDRSRPVPSEVTDERQIQGIGDCDTGAPTPSGRANRSAAGLRKKTRRAAGITAFPKNSGRPVCPLVPCVWPDEASMERDAERARKQYEQEAGK